MIVNCPHCHAQSKIAPSLNPGEIKLNCLVCDHSWEQGQTKTHFAAPSASLKPRTDTPPVQARVINLPIKVYDTSPQIDTEYLLGAAHQLRHAYLAKKKSLLRSTLVWCLLISASVMPVGAAMAVPEQLVAYFPAAIKIYDRLNWSVNVYGLSIARIEQQNRIVDGQQTLMIKGEIENVTREFRKVPALTLTLIDKNGIELHSWVHTPEVRPLQGGEQTSFTTRLTAPPPTAVNLKIRFAHRSEIGSNSGS